MYFILMCLLFLFSGMSVSGQQKYDTRTIKPVSYPEKLSIDISGKKRSYYVLDNKQSVDLNLTGPGILRVLLRGQFAPADEDQISYKVLYSIDGGVLKEILKTKVKKSQTATFLNGSLGVPGQLRDYEITLGRGDHNLSFLLDQSSNPVITKFKFTPVKKKKQDWIRFSPSSPLTPIDLISRESRVKYHRITPEQPMVVKINGPTELRVLTRVENQYHMKGLIHYRIQVNENGIVKNTYHLSSKRSEITEYSAQKDLVPGKACEFVIDVPKGKNIYEISLLDKNGKTILGRILIPEKDVGL